MLLSHYVIFRGNIMSLFVTDLDLLINLNPLVLKKLYPDQSNEIIELSF